MSMQQMTQPASSQAGIERARQQAQVVRRLHTNNTIAIGVLWAITVIVTVLFIAIIVYLLIQGAPALLSLGFYGTGATGIAAELFNTFYILILTEVILFPISLGAAIYLIEYAHQGQLVTIIHFAAETLAGVPSIVLGLFGFAAFAVYGGFGISRLAGALTLLCLNFPQALRLFEAALESVPGDLREGSLALIASDTLTTRLYFLKGPGAGSSSLSFSQESILAAGIAAVLILILLIINISARSIGRLIERRLTAA